MIYRIARYQQGVEERALRNIAFVLGLLLALQGCAAVTPPQQDARVTAETAYAAGEFERAAAAYARLEPTALSAQDWFRLANSRIELGRFEAAAAAYRQALAADPDLATARHNLGLLYIQLGLDHLLQARRQLPAVDPAAEATMRYLNCIVAALQGRAPVENCDAGADTL